MNKAIALILIFCFIFQVAVIAQTEEAVAKPKEEENGVKIRNGIMTGFTIGFLSAAVLHAFGVPFLSEQDILNHLVLGGIGAIAGYYLVKSNIEKEKRRKEVKL